MEERDDYQQKKALIQKIINEYRNSTKAFSKHGILGWIAATYLLNEIIKNCENIQNEQAKLFVLRSQLKSFVARGESHCWLPNSSTSQYGLRGRIVTRFFNKPASEIASLSNNLKQKQTTKENSLSGRRKELNIPSKGIPYSIMNRIFESAYKVNLNPDLYSHFKLKVKKGIPCDVFDHPIPDGIYQFVVTKKNEFRFLPTKPLEENDERTKHYQPFLKYRAHHQIAGGENVYSAGNFEVQDQKIIWIDGGSGHYGTEEMKFVDYAVSLLEFKGINTDEINKKACQKITLKGLLYKVTDHAIWFFRGIFSLGQSSGEVFQNRPSTEGVWENKIPKF